MTEGNSSNWTSNTKPAYTSMHIHSTEINSSSMYKLYNERTLNPCVAVGTQEAGETDTEMWSMQGTVCIPLAATAFTHYSTSYFWKHLASNETTFLKITNGYSQAIQTHRLHRLTTSCTTHNHHTADPAIHSLSSFTSFSVWTSNFCDNLRVSFILRHQNLDVNGTDEFLGKQLQVLKEWINILCLHFWKNRAIKLPEVTIKSIPSMFKNSCYVPLQSGTVCFKINARNNHTHFTECRMVLDVTGKCFAISSTDIPIHQHNQYC